jgi:hypothetical protein
MTDPWGKALVFSRFLDRETPYLAGHPGNRSVIAKNTKKWSPGFFAAETRIQQGIQFRPGAHTPKMMLLPGGR